MLTDNTTAFGCTVVSTTMREKSEGFGRASAGRGRETLLDQRHEYLLAHPLAPARQGRAASSAAAMCRRRAASPSSLRRRTTSRGDASASRNVIACTISGESKCGSARGTCQPLCSRSGGLLSGRRLEGRRPAARAAPETRALPKKSLKPPHAAALAARIAARAHCSQNGVPSFAAARNTAIWRSSSSNSRRI